jgi:hypothetical protein
VPVILKPRSFVLLLASLVMARSLVFVFVPASHFDSDQAVTGLMAKHLSELRAFPVFWYGQTYMLGVEAWLAAPIMAVAGATVAALKLPLLAMNVAIAVLLFRGFVGEGLSESRAAVAALPFALAAPITAAHFLTANGGNVEPCLYVLLLWILRRRALWFGVVLGVGFLNREFTIYGAAAVLLLDAVARTLFTREALRRYGVAFSTAGAVWIACLVLRHFSSAAGPGTSTADLAATLASNNLLQVAERLCFNPRAIASGVGAIFTVHWPDLFGLEPQRLTDVGIESTVRQGMIGASWLLAPALGIPLARGLTSREQRSVEPAALSSYLILVAALSIAGYLIGRCGVVDFYTMRYELLSVLGACGLAARYLRVERSRAWTAAWALGIAGILALSAVAHARLVAEYLTGPPLPAKQELIAALDARGIRYAYADYWTSYYVDFLARERIIVASDDIPKVRTYNRVVGEHRGEAIRISRRPCPGGEPLTSAFWACRP